MKGSKQVLSFNTRIAAIALVAMTSSTWAHAADPILPEGVVALTPQEIKWESTGALAKSGNSQANIIGAPDKVGPYTIRLKFPAGYTLAPHSHPDSRHITILSGTWYTGYGDKFDASKLKALPAGSIYTEPAGVPHFVVVREETIIQVSGTGPSGRQFVDNHDHGKPAATPTQAPVSGKKN